MQEKSDEVLCVAPSSCLSWGRFLGAPWQCIPWCRGMKGSSVINWISWGEDLSWRWDCSIFSQHTVMVWPLHSRSQMTWSCLVLLKCSVWLGFLVWVCMGKLKRIMAQAWAYVCSQASLQTYFLEVFGLSVPFQSMSGHLEGNKIHRLLLVDIRPPCFRGEEPSHITVFALRAGGWSQQGSSLQPPNPCCVSGKGAQFLSGKRWPFIMVCSSGSLCRW